MEEKEPFTQGYGVSSIVLYLQKKVILVESS